MQTLGNDITNEAGLSSAAARPYAAPGFWENCGTTMSSLMQAWRGTSVLVLGESFGSQQDAGKSAQVVQRLRRLNPALRVESQCGPAQGLMVAGHAARAYSRRSFDAALVFIGPAQLTGLESQDNFVEAAEQAIAAIARTARSSFLVAAFDLDSTTRSLPPTPQTRIAARRRRWLERTLQILCERHGVTWVPLMQEEGCLSDAAVPSFNFSVDGFRPGDDPHEMWTARMLQQPALAQLVFH